MLCPSQFHPGNRSRESFSLRQPRPRAQPFSFSRQGQAGCCARKNGRLDSASGLPQRNHKQLMLECGPLRATELKRLTQLRISQHTETRSGSRGARSCRISVSAYTGISRVERSLIAPWRPSPCTAAPFRIIGRAKTRENHARRHRLAATRLKFAARLKRRAWAPRAMRLKSFNPLRVSSTRA